MNWNEIYETFEQAVEDHADALKRDPSDAGIEARQAQLVLLRRYNRGERSPELYDAMQAAE